MIGKLERILKYPYRNFIAPKLYSIRDRKILSRNLTVKDKYSNQRCFVVGSGPSLSNIDFAQLQNEYTFVCNEFDKNPRYGILKPKFHITCDSVYYTEGEGEYFTEQFKLKDKTIPTTTAMIINLAAKPFMDKYGLFKRHQVYYVGTQGIFTDKLPFNIELDRYIPYPKNSALMCMLAAVYMGFREIILIGCEHGFLNKPITVLMEHSADDYPEDLKQADMYDQEVMKKFNLTKNLRRPTYENAVASVLQLFKSYRLFYKKVKKNHPNTNIYNATPNSFLDVFPFVNLDNVLNKKDNHKF